MSTYKMRSKCDSHRLKLEIEVLKIDEFICLDKLANISPYFQFTTKLI